jgi:hypothetical protein
MGLSGLNSQRFTYNLIPSPTCTLCNLGAETALHYFWTCPSHMQIRQTMIDSIQADLDTQASNENILELLLFGKIEKDKQKQLLNIAVTYIKNSKRFL